jgi:hypothetical protein
MTVDRGHPSTRRQVTRQAVRPANLVSDPAQADLWPIIAFIYSDMIEPQPSTAQVPLRRCHRDTRRH